MQAARRAIEGALQQVAGQLLLRPFARPRGLVDVRALLLVAAHQALLRHDLQRLQNGGVLRRLAGGDGLVDFADGARAAAPENGEDFEFGIGRPGQILRHIRRHYYEVLRMSSRKISRLRQYVTLRHFARTPPPAALPTLRRGPTPPPSDPPPGRRHAQCGLARSETARACAAPARPPRVRAISSRTAQTTSAPV